MNSMAQRGLALLAVVFAGCTTPVVPDASTGDAVAGAVVEDATVNLSGAITTPIGLWNPATDTVNPDNVGTVIVPDDDDPPADDDGGSTAISYELALEPDDFADGTALTDALAGVTLSTTLSDNVPVEAFVVTASVDGLELAPTGDTVFGHADVQFFNNERRLRLDFDAPVKGVSLQFAGGTFFETEIGRLEAYDADGELLAEYVSQPMAAGESEELSIARASAEIAFAIAYVAEGEGSFGRLDALRIDLE